MVGQIPFQPFYVVQWASDDVIKMEAGSGAGYVRLAVYELVLHSQTAFARRERLYAAGCPVTRLWNAIPPQACQTRSQQHPN